jgi:hypothetical protein
MTQFNSIRNTLLKTDHNYVENYGVLLKIQTALGSKSALIEYMKTLMFLSANILFCISV